MSTQRTSLLTRSLFHCLLAIGVLNAPSFAFVSVAEPPTQQQLAQAAQGNDMEKLESMSRERLHADSDDPFGWFYLGYALHLQGELDEAIVAHAFATQNPQTAPLATYNLGCAHALKGNTDKAFDALRKAVRLGINNPTQFANDSDLTSLKSDPRWAQLLSSLSGGQKADAPSGTNNAKALHFWVGEWDCYSAQTGQKIGTNTLTLRVNDSVVHESWRSLGSPYVGESWNHYDPRKDEWVQTWIGTTGAPGHDIVQIRATPSDDREGLFFEGTSMEQGKPETTKRVRMHVFEIGDGLVRQTGGDSVDDGATWNQRYDIIYVPKGRDFSLEDLGI